MSAILIIHLLKAVYTQPDQVTHCLKKANIKLETDKQIAKGSICFYMDIGSD